MESNSLLCRMTIASIEKIFIEDLTSIYGPEEASSIAWLTIGFVCRINRSQYISSKYDDLNETELASFHRILTELKKEIPVQYVLGETEFYGSVFKVDPSVLIPRPETEELVDWVLKDLKALKHDQNALKVLDIGTGSGCIPVTIKKYLQDATVFGMDVSSLALDKARENAILNQTEVNFIEDNILLPMTSQSGFDIIISNPPYVMIREKEQMHANVLNHEPHTALFVPDEDPLIFYNAIADFAQKHLLPHGHLYLEINENLGAQTLSLLKIKGFKTLELKKDLRDKDRMIKAQLN